MAINPASCYQQYGDLMRRYAESHGYNFVHQDDNHDNQYYFSITLNGCVSYVTLTNWSTTEVISFHLNQHSITTIEPHGIRICQTEVCRFDDALGDDRFDSLFNQTIVEIEECTRAFVNDQTSFFIDMLSSPDSQGRYTAIQQLNTLLPKTPDHYIVEIVKSIMSNPLQEHFVKNEAEKFLMLHN